MINYTISYSKPHRHFVDFHQYVHHSHYLLHRIFPQILLHNNHIDYGFPHQFDHHNHYRYDHILHQTHHHQLIDILHYQNHYILLRHKHKHLLVRSELGTAHKMILTAREHPQVLTWTRRKERSHRSAHAGAQSLSTGRPASQLGNRDATRLGPAPPAQAPSWVLCGRRWGRTHLRTVFFVLRQPFDECMLYRLHVGCHDADA